MRIARTLPPAAAPFPLKTIFSACAGYCNGEKEVARFELELKQYFDVNYSFAVSSGKAALVLILQALHKLYPERNEVIIPAFTCFSVPASIKRAGLSIRICDMDPETLDFDLSSLGRLIDEAEPLPLCVLPTHLFGFPADIETIRSVVGGQVVIVEDAAQALGGVHAGVKLGTGGDIAFFSLGRGKSFSAMGGGILITNRDDIGLLLATSVGDLPPCSHVASLRLFLSSLLLTVFVHPALFWFPKALPFLRLGETIYETDIVPARLAAFQAGLARGWQKRLHVLQRQRKKRLVRLSRALPISFSEHYHDRFQCYPDLIRFLLRLPDRETRDRVIRKSEQSGLGIMPVYPAPVSKIPDIAVEMEGQQCSHAEKLSETMVTLPLHPYVTLPDLDRMIELLLTTCPEGFVVS